MSPSAMYTELVGKKRRGEVGGLFLGGAQEQREGELRMRPWALENWHNTTKAEAIITRSDSTLSNDGLNIYLKIKINSHLGS